MDVVLHCFLGNSNAPVSVRLFVLDTLNNDRLLGESSTSLITDGMFSEAICEGLGYNRDETEPDHKELN